MGPGAPTPFPTPDRRPDLARGMHSLLANNIWCASCLCVPPLACVQSLICGMGSIAPQHASAAGSMSTWAHSYRPVNFVDGMVHSKHAGRWRCAMCNDSSAGAVQGH